MSRTIGHDRPHSGSKHCHDCHPGRRVGRRCCDYCKPDAKRELAALWQDVLLNEL